MKFILNKSFFLIVCLVAFTSCEDFLGGDLNTDPNQPTSVPVTAQMPSIQINLADVYGSDFSRFNCMLSQQVEGVARQWSSMNQYTGLTPNRFDDSWQNVYENILNEIKLARVTATEGGFNHYLGILDVMEAFTITAASDVWGDMPYAEALQGVDVISPVYDPQANIYAAALAKLESAITLLSGGSGGLSLGSDDVFYGGEETSAADWIKAAHAVKARTLLKQGEYTKAQASAESAFTDASGNWAFQYPDANAAGGWYRFNRDREGDIEFHPQMQALMDGLNDVDRVAVMNPTFLAGPHPYLVADFLQEMVTYREMQFIIAEADVRAGNTQTGYDAYLNGIRASFTRLGLGDAEYDAYVANAAVAPGAGNLTLEMVMTQKYIAMFLQPEVYSDWRRTDIPALSPVAGADIPVRWHYSSDEYLFNANSPSEADVNIFTDKVGWDN